MNPLYSLAHSPQSETTLGIAAYVEERLPSLWASFVKNVGLKKTNVFFDEWSQEDVNELEPTIAKFRKFLKNEAPPYVTARLYHMFGKTMSRELVVGYSNAILKKFAREQNIFFLSGKQIQITNPYLQELGALLYSITEAGNLHIFQIASIHAGHYHFKVQNPEKILEIIQTQGLHLYVKGILRKFDDKNTLFANALTDKALSIAQTDELNLENNFVLISPDEVTDYGGFFVKLEVGTSELRKIFDDFIETEVKLRHHGQTIASSPDLFNRFRNPDDKLQIDQIFRQRFLSWFRNTARWPQTKTLDTEEQWLNKQIKSMGGQLLIYLHYMEPEDRKRIRDRGLQPAIVPFESYLLNLDPLESIAPKALVEFFRAYVKAEILNTKDSSPPPIVSKLLRKNQGWQNIVGGDLWRNISSEALSDPGKPLCGDVFRS